METLFWISASLVVYAYAGYPLLVYVLSRRIKPTAAPAWASKEHLPTTALLIAAHNEQTCIADRIENALQLEYPRDKIEIVVASDGSDDETNEIVNRYANSNPNVKLLSYPERRGKSAMLNQAVSSLQQEIVVLSDANTMYTTDAVRRLVAWFVDPDVSSVCGMLILVAPESGANVDNLYWRYETFLKKCEARLGALLGANGAIYAIRRARFVPIPDNTIIDDFTIPLVSKLKFGGSIVYDECAIAEEEIPPAIHDEFKRRTRIGAGAYQSLAVLWPLLHPKHGWTAFTFLNHKVLRWTVPLLLVVILVSNLVLMRQPLYLAMLILQASFYAIALAGVWIRGNGRLAKISRGASLFCAMNAALAVGFCRWAFVNQRGTWQRTSR